MFNIPQIKQLCANLMKATLNHRDDKIKNILNLLNDEINIIDVNTIKLVNKLIKHRDKDISKISKSLIKKWNDIDNENKPTKENGNSNNNKIGNVYIASMSRGCKWPEVFDKNGNLIKRINVTSGSKNKIDSFDAKQVSPMYLGPINKDLVFNKLKIAQNNKKNDDLEANLFENYWQYGKIFKDLGHLDKNNKFTKKWLKFRKKGYSEKKGHRHPKGTKTNEILYKYTKGNNNKKQYNKYKYHIATTSYYFGEYMDYITSRKKVYCPIYEILVNETNFYKALKEKVCQQGMDVIILDFDGPKSNENYLKITQKMLREKINDPRSPFGHGYVFGAMLAGIDTSKYCQ